MVQFEVAITQLVNVVSQALFAQYFQLSHQDNAQNYTHKVVLNSKPKQIIICGVCIFYLIFTW